MSARITYLNPKHPAVALPSHRPHGCRCQCERVILGRRVACRRPAAAHWDGRDLCRAHFRKEVGA